VFYLVLGAILAALPIGYFVFLGEPAPPPREVRPPPLVEQPKFSELKLSEVQGPVEIRRGKGDWQQAKGGDVLQSSDAVRTGDGASAELSSGDAYDVKMEAGTEVAVDELTQSISRLLLGKGMATARVRGAAKHTFEVKASGSDATARTRAGTFTISNNAEGTVAVGTREGEVEFAGKGRVVIVRAGQQSIVHLGEAPTDPAPIPTSLFLKVRWPTSRDLARKKLVLTGQVEPGASLEIAGRSIRVGADGDFSETLTLAEGRNPIRVRARDVGGLEGESSSEVNVDTTPPQIGVDRNLWGPPK